MALAAEGPEGDRPVLNGAESLVTIEDTKVLRKDTIIEKLSEWFLGMVMWMCLIFYLSLLIMIATGSSWSGKVNIPSVSSYIGLGGIINIVVGGPVYVIIFCAVIYLRLFPRTSRRPMKKKAPKADLGSHPMTVRGPFGVVSAAELVWLVIFSIIFTWLLIGLISLRNQNAGSGGWEHVVKGVALILGVVGLFCINLLFIPVARGSPLLRLVDIPFEHATKYHVWLGHFTMVLYTLHGVGYIIPWIFERKLLLLLHWKKTGVAILPGLIAFAAGLIMWVTSFIRKQEFELFFYCHQLYIIFIVGMAFHVGDRAFAAAFAGIFIFVFDRFLRFCQSRKEVDVLAAKVLPCGTLELMLPKPANVKYNALSFVFLNIPSLSRLQWHPFSVSSSPEDGLHQIRFLVKPLGRWTQQLSNNINKAITSKCPFSLKAAVEGPYGHETSFFLNYEALLLVAGGIGISPFIAILRDLLHRHRREELHLPRDVTLIWAVKKEEELAILNTLSPLNIFPGYEISLNLIVKAFVTQETEADTEKGGEGFSSDDKITTPSVKFDFADSAPKNLSHLAGSGDVLWVGAAFFASLFGYFLLTWLFGKYYLLPADHETFKIVPWPIRIAILWTSILFGIFVFGGSVILLWHLVGTKSIGKQSAARVPLLDDSQGDDYVSDFPAEKLIQRSNTTYGTRPDLHEIFESCAKRLNGTNVGVLVCGPDGLQSEVGNQCRAFNTGVIPRLQVAFSYHSVSFDL